MGKFWKFNEDKTETKRLGDVAVSAIVHILDSFDFKYYDERCEYIDSFIEIKKSGSYLIVRYWGDDSEQESVVKLEFPDDRRYLLDRFISSNLHRLDLNSLDLTYIFGGGDYANKYLALRELVD